MQIDDLFRNPEFYVPYASGDTIFTQGDHGEKMYFVIEGEVDIQIKNNLVASLGPGELFGEMSVIDPKPRSATAIAKTDCRLAPMNQKRFLFLVQQNPQFALHIMRILVERLRRLDALIE